MTAGAAALPQPAEHPAPHRAKASVASLWVGLMLAPGAWFVQLVVDTTLLSNACAPRDTPLTGALPWLMPIVLGVDAAALLATVFAALVAWRNWRRTVAEKPGDGHQLLASGDGRTRFMAMAGLLVCGLIGIAIVYIGACHAALPECGL
jgi:hypothetical protein